MTTNKIADTDIEEDKAHLDNVHFYCPICDSILFQLQHHVYTCKCGLKWITPEPICLSDINNKAIRMINGRVK
jgi:hypothetical protein